MVSTPTVARPQAEETESVEPDSDDPENIENQEQAVMKTRKEQSLSNN